MGAHTPYIPVALRVAHSANLAGGGINYIVPANNGAIYVVYVDSAADVVFTKSTDGGFTWSFPVAVFAGTTVALAVYYDRWSGRSTDKIRCAYTESGGSDILYRDIDTANSDALGTQTTVFAGTDTASGGALTITVGRDGRLCVAGSIDAGAEDGAWSSTDDGATWGDTIADPSEGATQDQYLLLPGWNADTADLDLYFWDASADEISVKRYDDDMNTWGETSISTGMVDTPAATHFRNFDAAVDLTNSQNVVVGWTADDLLNADLKCWTVTDSAITAKTDVVTNSTDDQGMCAITIDTSTGYWWVFYGGKSDGSETWNTVVTINYKVSTDQGATWSAERQVHSAEKGLAWMISAMRSAGRPGVATYAAASATTGFFYYAPFPHQRAPTLTGGFAV